MGLFGNKELTFGDIKKIYLKGNLKKALKECKKYLANHADDYDALNLIGDIQYKLGQKNEALNTYKKLIDDLEKGKYLDKLIAQIRKVLKFYPDEYDLYRKLAEAFEKKKLKGEQLRTLMSLSDLYEKNGFIDKSIDILKEITEIDRTNLNNYVKVLERLDKFGKSFEICKFLFSALSMVYEKYTAEKSDIAKKYLFEFSDYALKHKCDLSELIVFMVPFFEEREEDKDKFIEAAKLYLKNDFNEDLYRLFKKYYPIDSDLDYYLNLKDKYKKVDIYSDLAEYFLKKSDNDNLKKLIDEINNLPDYDFNLDFINIVESVYQQTDDTELLDGLVVLAGKCKAKNLQIEIYKKMSNIYYENGENEKAERIIDYINELEHGVLIADKESEPLEETTDFQSLEESDTIDLETTSFDILKNDVELDLDIDLDTTKFEDDTLSNETDISADSNLEESFDIDLDLVNEQEEEKIMELAEDVSIVEEETEFDVTLDEFDLEDFQSETEEKVAYEKLEGDELEDITAKENEQIEQIEIEEIEPELKEESSSEVLKFSDEETKILEAMRKSIEDVVSEDDYETHYDLGLAYFELELFEDAIEEFKKSSYGEKRYESLHMLAECYKKLGKIDEAANIHKLIIADYDDTEKIKTSLYELATIYEEKGYKDTAKNYFDKLSMLDKDFRDVRDKVDDNMVVESDQTSVGEEQISVLDDKTKKKKKKISFL
ncbi:tetratricopeptide repeat protein [Deferribacter thermophilus]|uniref:tetratricopeptide repeat protein n=1 Tax=Deferribacter thermophilus TaxID=53573 RepID=UPI003C130C59